MEDHHSKGALQVDNDCKLLSAVFHGTIADLFQPYSLSRLTNIAGALDQLIGLNVTTQINCNVSTFIVPLILLLSDIDFVCLLQGSDKSAVVSILVLHIF